MVSSTSAKAVLQRLVPNPKHALWRATPNTVAAVAPKESPSSADTGALLQEDLHNDDVIEREPTGYAKMYQNDLNGPKKNTLHAWNRLHPSLGAFCASPKNQVAVQAMPKHLQELLAKDPNPTTQLQDYQDTLSASTKWLNDYVATQMKTPTGESAYTTEFLTMYDAMVWRHNSPFHWRIRQEEAQGLYNDCLLNSQAHCEVAVGTGLFLSELDTTSTQLNQLLLVDLQEDALEACQNRLSQNDYFANHVHTDTLHASILDDLPSHVQGQYDTVAANFLVHCLPRGPNIVRRTFANCASLLSDGGLFFGTTILGQDLIQDGDRAGESTMNAIRWYNKVGVFGNDEHTFQDFSAILHELFEDVEIWRIGYCVAWKARVPKKQPRQHA